MTSSPSPWDDIAVPVTDLNVRLLAGDRTSPCFWGRDSTGACLFIVELEGDHASQYRANVVAVNGLKIDLRGERASKQRLVLALDRQVDRDLFEGMCNTLASALNAASDPASSLSIALAHIRRWKTFLSGRAQHLSPEEVRGLFAELKFFLELSDRIASSEGAVEAWLGPDRSQHDFVFGNAAVEIKALSGSERRAVRVSSEDQLESLQDDLFLRVYRLSNLAQVEGACSLNDMVTTARTRLADAEMLEAFDRKLVHYGYAPLPDYDSPAFVVSEVLTYRIEKTFPKLVRSELPLGIRKVSYDIQLETLTDFACEDRAIFGAR